jgi:hypothetical protein
LFFNNSWKNESRSLTESQAGVKACPTPCRQRYYDCVNRYSSSSKLITKKLKGKRVNTQYRLIQTMIAVLDDASLVGWRQSYRVK